MGRSGVRLQGAGWVDLGDTGAGYSHSSCTPTPRIYKMGSSCFVTGCFLCFGLVSFYEILKRHQYRKNVRHLVISYIPFCMIVHQKSQQPNKTKKTPLKDVHGDTMHLLSILAGGLPRFFLTQPLPRAALWTMATSNQRLDQI